MTHRAFRDLPGLLRRGDVLVFNDAKVLPARVALRKASGGLVEGLFVGQVGERRWQVLLRNLGGAKSGVLHFPDDPSLTVRVVERGKDGLCLVEVSTDEPAERVLARFGRMPLPPYIKRDKEHDARDDADRERYQTVYAAASGSVAAPTAGLHFTPELLADLDAMGVARARVTLHVGMGTFKPVSAEKLEQHTMHTERYVLDAAACETLNAARRNGRRIIAVGTTSARVLESQPDDRPFTPTAGETAIFIYPGYRWRHVRGLITNFHLPRSTLIALVAALVGLEAQRRLYAEAIAQRYRFFSYGDAMLVE
jgi:S-adenosylmethionine:tRNA ribosyltransferase-isomerase